jgi:hypothetical protein
MKLTRPGRLRSLAAYPRCSTDQSVECAIESNPSPTRLILIRLLLAACAGAATVGGVHLSEFLALAALDGGRDLSAMVFYGIPVSSSFLLPLFVVLGLRLAPRWRAATVGLGGALGATIAILAVAPLEGQVAWLFALPALGTLVGTYAWRPASDAAPRVGQNR